MDKQKLASMLRCPICKGAVKYSADTETFACMTCQKIWCGRPLPFVASYDAGFNERWKNFPKPQATTAGVLTQKTGFATNDLVGKVVLDAGCGCGRFSAVAGSWGADVVGVDMSPAGLKAASENAPNATLIQASLLDLPFRDGVFDAAFSVGVLHHTENTKRAFMEVARTVKPNGTLAVWVYAKTWDDKLTPMMNLLHDITRACPPDRLYDAFAKYAVKIRNLYAINHETHEYNWESLEQILRISFSADDDECISDSIDWHTPQYRYHHSNSEVIKWFNEAGFHVDWVGDFPTSVRGTKR